MSRTLALVGAGWDSVRRSVARGRRTEVLPRLRQLLARQDLPTGLAGDAHRLAGELLLEAEQYSQARRHLREASRLQPKDALTYYQWGLAHERDPHGSDLWAARLFCKASRLQPKDASYRAAFGRALIRCDQPRRGTRELLAAAAEAAGDIEIIRVVVTGLLEAHRYKTANRVLTCARFLARTVRVQHELTSLLNRVRFETARTAQRETTVRQRQDAELAREGGRTVLPYLRLVETTKRDGSARSSTRRDVFSLPRPHRLRLPMRRADG